MEPLAFLEPIVLASVLSHKFTVGNDSERSLWKSLRHSHLSLICNMRIVAVFIMTLCLCTLVSAQKVYLTLTANPIDDITESPLAQARISLLNPVDSAEVDTFRIVKILGDLAPRYQYIYENSHAELPFKFIVSAANEGYETSYTDLSILPSEAKHDEVTHNLELS